MSTLAGEIQNPQRVIPRALMIGTPLVITTYFVTVWASIRIANLGGPDNYLNMWTGGGGEDFVQLAKVVGGAFFGYLMLMSAILSDIGLYAGYLATGARPQFQMSRDRLLPRFLGRTHGSWGTPWVAILLMGVVNAVLINFKFDALITIDVFLLMFPYLLIFLTVMIMRVKGARHAEVLQGPAPDLGARCLGRVPDRHRHHRPVRQRHGHEDGVPAHGQDNRDAPIGEQFAQVTHLTDAWMHMVVLHAFRNTDGDRFHVAPRHTAIGVQTLVDHDQVADWSIDSSSLTASQPPMLTRLSFFALIHAPSV